MAFTNRGGGGSRGGGSRRGSGGGGGRSNQPRREMVFHDALVTSSPLRVRVDSEPKWIDAKNNYIVELTIYDPEGGEPSELAYWAENPECGEFFSNKVGQTFTIIAEGGGKGKKETGLITYVGESGAAPESTPEPQRQQQQTSQTPSQRAPTQQTAKSGAAAPTKAQVTQATLSSLKLFGRLGSAIQLSAQQTLKEIQVFCAVNGIQVNEEQRKEFVLLIARHMTETTFSTMFIEHNKQSQVKDLPTKDVMTVIAEARERAAKGEPVVPKDPPAPKPKCQRHGIELDAAGKCAKCEEELKNPPPDDDVPF